MKIHYEIAGVGKPLLLIAGYRCDLSIWDTVQHLLAKHFQLILFDNRGVGRSDAPDIPYSIEMMGEDTLNLIDKLGLKKPHVLGHSMGGCIAQWLAFHHPEKLDKVILANTCIRSPAYFNLRCRSLLHLREANVPMKLINECAIPWGYSNHFLSRPDSLKELLQSEEEPFPQTLVGQRRQLEALEGFDSSAWYQKISTPTLVLASEEERIFLLSDAERLFQGIPGARFHLFKGIGHAPNIEAPEEFVSVILDFLGR